MEAGVAPLFTYCLGVHWFWNDGLWRRTLSTLLAPPFMGPNRRRWRLGVLSRYLIWHVGGVGIPGDSSVCLRRCTSKVRSEDRCFPGEFTERLQLVEHKLVIRPLWTQADSCG